MRPPLPRGKVWIVCILFSSSFACHDVESSVEQQSQELNCFYIVSEALKTTTSSQLNTYCKCSSSFFFKTLLLDIQKEVQKSKFNEMCLIVTVWCGLNWEPLLQLQNPVTIWESNSQFTVKCLETTCNSVSVAKKLNQEKLIFSIKLNHMLTIGHICPILYS